MCFIFQKNLSGFILLGHSPTVSCKKRLFEPFLSQNFKRNKKNLQKSVTKIKNPKESFTTYFTLGGEEVWSFITFFCKFFYFDENFVTREVGGGRKSSFLHDIIFERPLRRSGREIQKVQTSPWHKKETNSAKNTHQESDRTETQNHHSMRLTLTFLREIFYRISIAN